jgi:uncharacterized membrane protein YoaK (UPF0700 family)
MADLSTSMTATHDAVEPRLMFAVMTMTFVTGFVDAVSYLGLGHVFTANMTGNVVLLGFAVVGATQLSVARSLTSLAAFMVGAAIGGRIALRSRDVSSRRWLVTAGMSEVLMLFIAASAAMVIDRAAPLGVYAVIVFTALPMGLRTATVRRLGVADITTTVLTTTLAGLTADSSLVGGNNPRFRRRIGSVLAMCTGAGLGAVLMRVSLALPLVVGAACVLVAVVYAARSGTAEAVAS